MKLEHSVALITGAGRGIGRAIALTLANQGATVILTARTKSELEAVRNEIVSKGGKALALQADITNDNDVKRLVDEAVSQTGRLDILVNNAGMGIFKPFKELTVSDFDRMWNLNMRALFLCTQHAVKIMEKQKGGMIVNVSSLAGKNAFLGGAGYAATKWALMGFSKCLMLEVREHNIRVITICPGSVDTAFSHHDPSKAEKILSPQDVAVTLLAAMSLPERAMVSEIDIRPTNPK
ncbi:MAG: SDR family NAD(P)-dependent oxidoreductase [Ignavibacteriales bacterium]|nr:SDR family NAD(P)-dependent oxidoreductase [Ignavibacteriales bacterium]